MIDRVLVTTSVLVLVLMVVVSLTIGFYIGVVMMCLLCYMEVWYVER